MRDSRDYAKPVGILLSGTYYNVGNIASFTTTANKATSQKFISVSFINQVNGQDGIKIAYNDDEWKALCYSFDYVSTAYGS